jgi:hypothetical protein
MVDHELFSRKPIVSLGSADGEFPCPVQEQLVRSEGRSDSLQPARLQTSQDLVERLSPGSLLAKDCSDAHRPFEAKAPYRLQRQVAGSGFPNHS